MTPALRRRAEVRRVMRWKRKHPGRYKLGQRESENAKTLLERLAERQSFLAGHTHTCVRCPRKYDCTNACDPVGEGVKSSICPGCFEKEARA